MAPGSRTGVARPGPRAAMIAPMDEALTQAIERLYREFAEYRLETPSPCATCYSPEIVARIEGRLRTTPLRDLTVDDIGHFYTDGVLTWGGVEDLRHLLPRLMELFAAHHLGEGDPWQDDGSRLRVDLDPAVSLLRFPDAEWWTWPAGEREAVDDFLFALWRAYLATDKGEWGVWEDEALPAAILRLTPDPLRFLAHWRACDWAGTRHLAAFVTHGDHTGIWWARETDGPTVTLNGEAIRRWLGEPATVLQLEDAARSLAPRDTAWEAVLALDVLTNGRGVVSMFPEDWAVDDSLHRRALELGVELPEVAAPTG